MRGQTPEEFGLKLKNVIKFNAMALQQAAAFTHQKSVETDAIPVDTGHLRDDTKKIEVVSHNQVALRYEAPYAGYVWKKNVTGIPEWTLTVFKENQDTIGKVYAHTILELSRFGVK